MFVNITCSAALNTAISYNLQFVTYIGLFFMKQADKLSIIDMINIYVQTVLCSLIIINKLGFIIIEI